MHRHTFLILAVIGGSACQEPASNDDATTTHADGSSGGGDGSGGTTADTAGLQLGSLIAFSIITETVFQWPGLGLLTLDAANHKDYPLILAITMAVTVLVVISSFVADLAYSLADPRIRLG